LGENPVHFLPDPPVLGVNDIINPTSFVSSKAWSETGLPVPGTGACRHAIT
jgi:hypothetical protein